MSKLKWLNGAIQVEPCKRPKKITGTHLPEVLGVHPYATAFEAWCRCTRTWEKPFEGNEYTAAGQVIEPKVFDFLRYSMGYGDRVVVPTDIYGPDPFSKTYGDFFPDTPVFGGSWDGLIKKEGSDEIQYVVEVKTVLADGHSGSLDERWQGGKAPHYQALQASLYAYLLGIDDVIMVAVSLSKSKGDYAHPEQVTPSYANENVYLDIFKVSERYPNFPELIESVKTWWDAYVLTGVSPAYDEKKDAEALKALRQNNVEVKDDMSAIFEEAEKLRVKLDEANKAIEMDEKRYKQLTDAIKEYMASQFREGDKAVSVPGKAYEWKYSKTVTKGVDDKRMKADGVYDKYAVEKISYRLTLAEKGE